MPYLRDNWLAILIGMRACECMETEAKLNLLRH